MTASRRSTPPAKLHHSVVIWQAITGRRDFASDDSFVKFHAQATRRALRKPKRQPAPPSWADRSQPPEREGGA